jgi:hypothetical protein
MRAILFDLDNTLIDRGAAFVDWITTIAPKAQIPALVALDAGGHGPKYPLFRAIADVTGWSVIETRAASSPASPPPRGRPPAPPRCSPACGPCPTAHAWPS